METNAIIRAIDAQITRLQEVRALLNSSDGLGKRRPGRPRGVPSSKIPQKPTLSQTVRTSASRRTMSPETRARIAEAQKARWAKNKKAPKKTTPKDPSASANKPASKVTHRNSEHKKTIARKKSSRLKPETVATSDS